MHSLILKTIEMLMMLLLEETTTILMGIAWKLKKLVEVDVLEKEDVTEGVMEDVKGAEIGEMEVVEEED